MSAYIVVKGFTQWIRLSGLMRFGRSWDKIRLIPNPIGQSFQVVWQANYCWWTCGDMWSDSRSTCYFGNSIGLYDQQNCAIARANNLTLVADNLPLVGNDWVASALMMCCCCFNSSCKTCPGCSTLSMGSRLALLAGHWTNLLELPWISRASWQSSEKAWETFALLVQGSGRRLI